jgi:leucyl aminopeptidase
MTLGFSISTTPPPDASAAALFVFEGLEAASRELSVDPGLCGLRGYKANLGECLLESDGGLPRVLVGLGPRDRFGPRELRRAAAAFVRRVPGGRVGVIDVGPLVGGAVSARRAAQAVAEGAVAATYRFSRYLSTEAPPSLQSVAIVVPEGSTAEAESGLERGRAIAEAVSLGRDLVNTPARDMSPSRLAEVAGEVAARAGLEITVLDEEQIQAERLGGLMGVARGSAEPARLIKLVYRPEADSEGGGSEVATVALVGKGITFDSGGLSLKSGPGMMTMKCDMSGAAAVIATLGACRALDVGVAVVGYAPATENMPGGRATKPGDILTTRNGKTIEVLNTDAEGRLVLSDALALAAEDEPDAIIDIATLTGACVAALGSKVAGLMSNDSRIVSAIERASAEAGEGVWHLPLPRAYRSSFESPVADMKNIGQQGNAGALVAGLILEEFVADRPWAHLDIAGPAFTEEETDESRKGGTGFSIATLLELLSSWQTIGAPADNAADGAVR